MQGTTIQNVTILLTVTLRYFYAAFLLIILYVVTGNCVFCSGVGSSVMTMYNSCFKIWNFEVCYTYYWFPIISTINADITDLSLCMAMDYPLFVRCELFVRLSINERRSSVVIYLISWCFARRRLRVAYNFVRLEILSPNWLRICKFSDTRYVLL